MRLHKKAARESSANAFDSQKESLFRELSLVLERAGFTVRREKLKQGYGWKVLSGACRVKGSKLVFVDKKLPQNDQIYFLLSKINSLGLRVTKPISACPLELYQQFGISVD